MHVLGHIEDARMAFYTDEIDLTELRPFELSHFLKISCSIGRRVCVICVNCSCSVLC